MNAAERTVNRPQRPRAEASDLEDLVASTDTGGRTPEGNFSLQVLVLAAFAWSAFQLWYASPLPFITGFLVVNDSQARGIHLGFALFLCFLAYPALKRSPRKHIPIQDWILALVGAFCATYRFWFYAELAQRPGLPTTLDIVVSAAGLILLLEAARRSLGPALVVIAALFMFYVFFGNASFVPDVIRYQGASFSRAMDQFWLTDQGVFGIAVGVSTRFVFLFVLFGALLDRAGAGNYFIKLAFSLLGHLRGGPAKAAVVSSGLTGLISGSSIANVVTTGTFTIPLMKRVGFSSEKAGAVEVGSSVNGQIMPPVMGAAAFLMIEYVGIPYTEVIRHAFLPAVISYIALLYIVHLEALKMGMKGLPKPGDPLPGLWGLIAMGITVASVLIIAGVVYFAFELASLLPQSSMVLLALAIIAVAQIVLFRTLRTRLETGRFRRTVSMGGLVLVNAVLASFALFHVMALLRSAFGPSDASWVAAGLAFLAYVGLVWYAAQYPELELDDPNAPVVTLPETGPTVKTGLYYLIPIVILVWNLMVERLSPGLSALWASVFMIVILVTQRPLMTLFRRNEEGFPQFLRFLGETAWNALALVVNYIVLIAIAVGVYLLGSRIGADRMLNAELRTAMQIGLVVVLFLSVVWRHKIRLRLLPFRLDGVFHRSGWQGLTELLEAMVAGARNMIGIGIATAAAGIIVGTVGLTGIGLVMSAFVEFLSGGNIIIMLILVAVLSLILGMGLPTTANYIVVSALMAPVVVEVGAANGLLVPLIAVHLFVFYFGIMADVTPPVGLASFAAAAVSGGDPIRTGVQAFFYSIRTAILPFLFIFNTSLILYDVGGPLDVIATIITATIAMLVFAAATMGYFMVRSRLWETVALLLVAFTLFRPGFWMDQIYPPTETLPGATVLEAVEATPPGSPLRMEATVFDIASGETRSRFVQLSIGPTGTPEERLAVAGITGLALDEETAIIQGVGFGSQADTVGLAFGDEILAVLVDTDRPPRELMWIPAFLLLGLVYFMQRRRQKHGDDRAPRRWSAAQR